MRKKTIAVVAVFLAAMMLFCGCSPKASTTQDEAAKDLNSLTMDELVELAKKDGHIESVGMPDDWANWGDSWKAISEKYGITHFDVDMSSAEEIAIMKSEGENGTKDIGDVGQMFTSQLVADGVTQGYKVSTWDTIPDWAKDPDGKWYISYTGTMTFIVNKTLTNGYVPTSWKELLDSDLVVSVGNVVGGASSQAGVLGAAIAFGGGFDNVQPGIDFFKELAAQNRLYLGDVGADQIANGDVQVGIQFYDFTSLNYRDIVNASDAGYEIEVVVPTDGAITSGYALTFNKYSPNPYATALAMEYLLSDEGQNDRAMGYARPIRIDSIQLSEEAQSKTLPGEMYANAIPVTDPAQLTAACAEISRLWEEELVPLF